MTLEEKIGLLVGLDMWHTKPIPRLGIDSIMMSDGPHGLRKQKEGEQSGIYSSYPATCFPTASCLASTWDRTLLEKVGKAIGKEAQAEGISIVLGPGVNIKRTPLCGRNFEYYSEDPYLASELAASYIMGIQSQGVGACIKHIAANNQEYKRFTINAVIDERTLREIYLAAFEGAIKKAKPWAVMSAYNKLNGEYCSHNTFLLTDILRKEFGFEGIVISDWGAVHDRAKALLAGLDLEMPSSKGRGEKQLKLALEKGMISEDQINEAVKRLLTTIFKALENKKENFEFDKEEHHRLAEEIATEGIVLLKNEDGILPLKREGVIGIIGAFAKHPQFEGGGSSRVNPTKVDIPFDEIVKVAGDRCTILYADGYKLDSDRTDDALIAEAKELARNCNVAVIFAGLPENCESEGYDRKDLNMPENHNKLIEEIANTNQNVVVVLMNGAPVEMPWIEKIKGLFECYLAGQAVGSAIAKLLFGEANPCGRLPETFPLKLSHNPAYLNYPEEKGNVEYREGIFIGYRYYDKKGMDVLFPFGYGLSYTTFEYYDLKVDKKEIKDNETVTVSVKIKNTGKLKGKEVVQLYVRDVESSVIRPEKELKGFEKVELAPGEEKEVMFVLNKRAFAYYDTELKDWYVESGEFEILIGKSSREIVLREKIKVESTVTIKKRYTLESTFEEVARSPKGKEFVEGLIEILKTNSEFGGENVDVEHMLNMVKDLPLENLTLFVNDENFASKLSNLLQRVNE